MRRRSALVLLVLLLAPLAACGTGTGDDGSMGTTPSAGGLAARLEGREFVGRSVTEGGGDRPLVPGTELRLGFADGRASASAGCNSMGADYRLDGDRLVVGPISTTEMGCDPERHDQDAWLAGVLDADPTVALEGAELTLTSGGTVLVLVDREEAEPDRDLVGPTWSLETLLDGQVAASVPSGLSATLRFGDDGTVEVDDGCRSVVATWEAAGDRLHIERPAEDDLCSADALGLATDVGVVVDADPAFAVDGDVLTLTAGEQGLQYRAG